MGNCWANVVRRKKNRRHIVLILIGLDNAGKTKTVNNLCGDQDDKVLPTVGFKAVNLIHKDVPVTIYDLGGGPQFRQIWPQYYSEVHGVIFVIDSSDIERLDECKAVLEEVLSHDRISGKPILVLANKQDKQGAMDDIDMVEKLNIEPLVNKYRCPTLVESYTATALSNGKRPKIDPGLKKGYQWLLNYIVRRYGDINLRVQTDIHAELERRKRLANRNRASQTFVVDSDEIATQTGFSNPNYETLSRRSEAADVIVVKPVAEAHSTNTTVTIETDSAPSSVGKPKLSPLFARTLERDSTILSPIVRKSSRCIDFENRPESSTSRKDESTSPSRNSSMQVQNGDSSFENGKRSATLNHVDLRNEGLILSDRDRNTLGACSSLTLPATVAPRPFTEFGAAPRPDTRDAPRPASASQSIRRQLEVAHRQKRPLSLRHVNRNKTSPEPLAIFLHDQTKLNYLEKGDYERAVARDVTL